MGVPALSDLARAGVSAFGAVDIQTYTSSGTWPKLAGARRVLVFVHGAGGGGASGERRASGTVSLGGSGGGPGGSWWEEYAADDLPATVPVTIGAPGVGGAGVTTDNTTGNPGTAGGDSAWGSAAQGHYLVAGGGQGGTPTTPGAPGMGRVAAVAGTASSPTGGNGPSTNSTNAVQQSYPGGPGAGQGTAPATANGGRFRNLGWTISGTYTGNLSVGSSKTNPNTPSLPFPHAYGLHGGGGPGGWCHADGTAGPGANGQRGGGGGGGGGALNGNASGAGGAGGAGVVIVVTLFG